MLASGSEPSASEERKYYSLLRTVYSLTNLRAEGIDYEYQLSVVSADLTIPIQFPILRDCHVYAGAGALRKTCSEAFAAAAQEFAIMNRSH
jgi:hypothetical protein